MENITILTPTYNRAHTLGNCFSSLQKQTNKNFIWLIIDDGSEDETPELVKKYIKEADFKIFYYCKENGGKHTALNLGFEKILTEYTMILDSDDILIYDAIETIVQKWEIEKSNLEIFSIVFLRGYSSDKVIGDLFPRDRFLSNHVECRMNLGIKGDKAEVFRTAILKQYRFPEFEGEKFIGEGILWNRIGKKYKSVYYNKIIYCTEYLADGLTKSGVRMRIKNPKGGVSLSNECMSKEYSLLTRIKYSILYNIYYFFLIDKEFIKNKKNNAPILTRIFKPISYIIYFKWKFSYLIVFLLPISEILWR